MEKINTEKVMNMQISTEIQSASAIIGEERTIEYLAKAGFDAWDFSMKSSSEIKHCLHIYQYMTIKFIIKFSERKVYTKMFYTQKRQPVSRLPAKI